MPAKVVALPYDTFTRRTGGSRSRSYTVDPNLPLWYVVQGLSSTDPTQETYGR